VLPQECQFKSLHFVRAKVVPKKVAIVRRAIVQGGTCAISLLANASARTPAREQLIDQLIVLVLGLRRGCCFGTNQNNNNNKCSCDGTRIFDGDKCGNLLSFEAGAHNVDNADDDDPVRASENCSSNAIFAAFPVGIHRQMFENSKNSSF
jgi:hypothetical protein